MTGRPPTPEVEAVIERTVRVHVRNARQDLGIAIGALETQGALYHGSPVFKLLRDALKATEIAERRVVETWPLRTARQGELLEELGEGKSS